MDSNNNLYRKYLNAKEKIKKLTSQQTPATAAAANKSNAIEKSIAEMEFTILDIENLYLIDDLKRYANNVRTLN